MDIKELLSILLERAAEGEHCEFKLITTWREYWFVRRSMQSLKVIIRTLTKSYHRTFKRYCREVSKGNPSVAKLFACNALQTAIDFYIAEYNIQFDMVDEFETYAAKGKFLDSLLFGARLEQDMWDHRKD